jgi:hypothetical protein
MAPVIDGKLLSGMHGKVRKHSSWVPILAVMYDKRYASRGNV